MILKIDKHEIENFKRECAAYGTQATFTIENNPTMVQVEILSDGKEITLLEAYWIGRSTGMNKMLRIYK